MYLVDRPEPSKQLIQARELAGRTIETMMRDKSPQGKSSQNLVLFITNAVIHLY